MQAGLSDAAIVGGADSLCLTTLCGFASLNLTAPGSCRPCDAGRDGISIGEASGFLLLEKAEPGAGDIMLLGIGEANDAYHMSRCARAFAATSWYGTPAYSAIQTR